MKKLDLSGEDDFLIWCIPTIKDDGTLEIEFKNFHKKSTGWPVLFLWKQLMAKDDYGVFSFKILVYFYAVLKRKVVYDRATFLRH